MIRFLVSRGHGYTFKAVVKWRAAPPVTLMSYDRLLRSKWLRRGTYVFADVDRLSFWDLELAAEAYGQLKAQGVPVWNNPARVKTRFALLRALHAAGLNDFNVHRADETRKGSSLKFPVFLRKNQSHDAPLTGLIHEWDELNIAIEQAVSSGVPGEHLVVIEFSAEPVRPGLWRKLSAFRIGDVIIPHISVHDTNWLVKYGQHGIATEDLYEEELRLLQTNPYARHLRQAFDLAGIEYGRADFGIYQGRVQIYEINTNPSVAWPTPHPSARRRQSLTLSWDIYLQALRQIDSPGGPLLKLANGKLQRHRFWSNLFVRTRKLA